MVIEEFEHLTGFYPTFALYEAIEHAYNEYSGDKYAFCDAYKYNAGGLAEKIQYESNMQSCNAQTDAEKMIKDYEAQIEKLKKSLEREQEWQPHGHSSGMTDLDYAKLTQSGKVLTDHEAKELIVKELGFDFDKIEIVCKIPTYEINRHKQLRQTGTINRPPVYDATDWNYIRFNCAGWYYEMINGQLHKFYD